MKLTKNVYVNVIDNRRNKDIRVDVDANSYLDTYGGFVEDTNQDPRHENSSSTKYKYRALDRQNIRYK
jgi:hypothetical protein